MASAVFARLRTLALAGGEDEEKAVFKRSHSLLLPDRERTRRRPTRVPSTEVNEKDIDQRLLNAKRAKPGKPDMRRSISRRLLMQIPRSTRERVPTPGRLRRSRGGGGGGGGKRSTLIRSVDDWVVDSRSGMLSLYTPGSRGGSVCGSREGSITGYSDEEAPTGGYSDEESPTDSETEEAGGGGMGLGILPPPSFALCASTDGSEHGGYGTGPGPPEVTVVAAEPPSFPTAEEEEVKREESPEVNVVHAETPTAKKIQAGAMQRLSSDPELAAEEAAAEAVLGDLPGAPAFVRQNSRGRRPSVDLSDGTPRNSGRSDEQKPSSAEGFPAVPAPTKPAPPQLLPSRGISFDEHMDDSDMPPTPDSQYLGHASPPAVVIDLTSPEESGNPSGPLPVQINMLPLASPSFGGGSGEGGFPSALSPHMSSHSAFARSVSSQSIRRKKSKKGKSPPLTRRYSDPLSSKPSARKNIRGRPKAHQRNSSDPLAAPGRGNWSQLQVQGAQAGPIQSPGPPQKGGLLAPPSLGNKPRLLALESPSFHSFRGMYSDVGFEEDIEDDIITEDEASAMEEQLFNDPSWVMPEDLATLENSLGSLGKGAGGQVHGVFHIPTCNIFALKATSHESEIQTFIILKDALGTDHAPQIMDLLGLFQNSDTNEISMVIEFMNLGSLHDSFTCPEKNHPCNENQIRHIARETLVGLKALHCYKTPIIHRDIKPHNILIESGGSVRVADYGLLYSLESATALCTSQQGTKKYFSPERHDGGYSMPADIWAFGITLVECILGALIPDEGLDPVKLLQDKAHPLDFLTPEHQKRISSECMTFLEQCLKRDPVERGDVDSLLASPFLASPTKQPEKVFLPGGGKVPKNEALLKEILQILQRFIKMNTTDMLSNKDVWDGHKDISHEKRLKNITKWTGFSTAQIEDYVMELYEKRMRRKHRSFRA